MLLLVSINKITSTQAVDALVEHSATDEGGACVDVCCVFGLVVTENGVAVEDGELHSSQQAKLEASQA